MTTENPDFVTIKEAAAILDRSTDNVRESAYAGIFERKTERQGHHFLTVVRRSDVEAYRDRRDAAASAPKTKEAEFPVKREGMGLHDWFAGQALAGLCANPEFMNQLADFDRVATAFELADKAYRIASAMTKGRDDCETPD